MVNSVHPTIARVLGGLRANPRLQDLLRDSPVDAFAAFGLAAPQCAGIEVAGPELDFPLSPALVDGLVSEVPVEPLLKRDEVRFLRMGTKPMVLLHGREDELSALAAWARPKGYWASFSPHEFQPIVEQALGGYSNGMAARRIAEPGSNWWRGLLLSPSRSSAILGWIALLLDWDDLLGALLGYPDCCRAEFERRWPLASSSYGGDVALLMAEETGPAGAVLPWQTNVFSRYFGYEVLQHFPCSFECEASIAMAERRLAQLASFDPDRADVLLDCLSSPVLVAGTSVAILRSARETAAGFVFDPRRVLAGQDLMDILDNTALLEGSGVSSWCAGDREFEANLLRFSGGDMQGQELAA